MLISPFRVEQPSHRRTSEEEEKVAICTQASKSEKATLWGEKKADEQATFPKNTASEMSTTVPKEPETRTVSPSKDTCSDLEVAGHSSDLTGGSKTGDLKHLENQTSAVSKTIDTD